MISRIRKAMDEKEQGFTLIELLVVMIIIGILAAIAIPIFLNQREAAHEAGVKSDLRTAANEVETHFVNNQDYPDATEWAAILADIELSEGTGLTYTPPTATDGYCIQGSNTNGSNTFAWDADQGGLQGAGSTC